MTAARITIADGVVTQAALAVGSCGPVATRMPAVENLLVGRPLEPKIITSEVVGPALSPIDDIRADAAYRAGSAAELLRRTVEGLT